MGLSRLAEQCRKCPFKDNCKNKRIEALGYLPEPIVAEAGASSAAELTQRNLFCGFCDTDNRKEKNMNEQIIAVDFDGTLCENKWPEIGEPNTNLIGYLIEMRKSFGAKIILWTCRVGEMLDKAVNWCSEHRLEFDAVNENLPHIIERFGGNTRKIFANMYIDDRNFRYDNKSPDKVLYLCDGGQCETCSNECNHTTDIDHAKNFNKEFGVYVEKENDYAENQ